MWPLLFLFLIPLAYGALLCYNESNGIPTPDRILVSDPREFFKWKKTY